VSRPSWFYKWHERPPGPRQRRRADLDEAVRLVFDASAGTYGSPRITAELQDLGWRVSKNTVAAVMAAQQLVARPKRRHRSLTRADKTARRAPDLVGRDFSAAEPNLKWCGDLTEIPTAEGKLYLAAVEDLFSRRLLGFAMSDRHDAELAVASLRMAAAVRGGSLAGVIFHTDQGSERGFNGSSQHLDHGGVLRWRNRWQDAGSGLLTGRCARRCGLRAGRRLGSRSSGSSGG
jgi:putative transposase